MEFDPNKHIHNCSSFVLFSATIHGTKKSENYFHYYDSKHKSKTIYKNTIARQLLASLACPELSRLRSIVYRLISAIHQVLARSLHNITVIGKGLGRHIGLGRWLMLEIVKRVDSAY